MKSCGKHGRRICTWCAVTTLGFPVEHVLWTKMPLLRTISVLFGL